MIFGTRTSLFKTRSPQRDQSADVNRVASIEQAIQRAISEAEKEKAGLTRRLDKSRHQASLTMGNETYGDLEREPESEKLLADAEKEISRAVERSRQLTAHLNELQALFTSVQKLK
jgi:hypothetical protein